MKPAVQQTASLTLRPATVDDINLIGALARTIWPVCYANALTPEQIENMLASIYAEQSLRKQMQEGQRFWIAYYNGDAAGYASAYSEDGVIWLKKLYCKPELQGQGVGSSLMNAAIEGFSPASEIRLMTNRDNTPAQAYYERKGFSRIGEIPVMMGDFPFVDYIYSKPLTGK